MQVRAIAVAAPAAGRECLAHPTKRVAAPGASEGHSSCSGSSRQGVLFCKGTR